MLTMANTDIYLNFPKSFYKLIGSIVYSLTDYAIQYLTFKLFEKEVWSDEIIKLSVMYGVTVIILLPLCLQKDLGKLRYISVFAIVSMIYVIMVIFNMSFILGNIYSNSVVRIVFL